MGSLERRIPGPSLYISTSNMKEAVTNLRAYETLLGEPSSLSEDASGLGLGKGVQSLGKGEIDGELDSSMEREAFLTRIPSPIPQI